jgi:hypothetical protein
MPNMLKTLSQQIIELIADSSFGKMKNAGHVTLPKKVDLN